MTRTSPAAICLLFGRMLGAIALVALALSSGRLFLTRAAADAPSSPGSPETTQDWLVDEQGRQYKVERLDKKLPHLRLDGNRVRSVFGITVDVVGEDERSFFMKVYRVPDDAGLPSRSDPTAEEKARVAATYQVDLPPSRTMSFEPFDDGLPRSGQWRYGFVLVDMNGDGHLDIVHGPPRRRQGPPVIFLGDGAGHWRRWQASFPALKYDYGNVAVADFNGDGHLDIAMGMHLLGMTVLLGDGAGGFKAASTGMDALDSQSGFSSHALVAVDWDGDGHVDIVALGEGPRLGTRGDPTGVSIGQGTRAVFYRNRGDATWEKKLSTQGLAGDTLALAQSRLGGRPWLVAGSITQGRSDLVLRPGDPFVTETLPGVRPGALVRAVALADFNGDGHEDVAVAYAAYEGDQWRSGIDLVLRKPDGSVERRTVFVEDGPLGVMALAAGDLDGDGRPDLVALSGNGETVVLRNTGGGSFAREDVQLTERVAGCRGYQVRVQDLDKDGRADIVASFAGESEGLGPYRIDGCQGQGSLRAWRSRPRS